MIVICVHGTQQACGTCEQGSCWPSIPVHPSDAKVQTLVSKSAFNNIFVHPKLPAYHYIESQNITSPVMTVHISVLVEATLGDFLFIYWTDSDQECKSCRVWQANIKLICLLHRFNVKVLFPDFVWRVYRKF